MLRQAHTNLAMQGMWWGGGGLKGDFGSENTVGDKTDQKNCDTRAATFLVKPRWLHQKKLLKQRVLILGGQKHQRPFWPKVQNCRF